MEIHKDFADLCSSLNANGVEFLIVGGYAVAFHGAPRFTGDLDILVRSNIDHADRVVAAVREFGFPTDEVTAQKLLERQSILQLGRTPVQIHIMTGISGVEWGEAWESRQPGHYGSVPVYFIGRSALLANQRAAG
jgi:hypothetical protein